LRRGTGDALAPRLTAAKIERTGERQQIDQHPIDRPQDNPDDQSSHEIAETVYRLSLSSTQNEMQRMTNTPNQRTSSFETLPSLFALLYRFPSPRQLAASPFALAALYLIRQATPSINKATRSTFEDAAGSPPRMRVAIMLNLSGPLRG
jgi:hypothetical protein